MFLKRSLLSLLHLYSTYFSRKFSPPFELHYNSDRFPAPLTITGGRVDTNRFLPELATTPGLTLGPRNAVGVCPSAVFGRLPYL